MTVTTGQTSVQVNATAKFSLGQVVTLTATVSPTLTVPAAPTGTVTFADGSLILGTGTLQLVGSQLEAALLTALLPTGTTSVTASYSGDANFLAVKSAAVKVTPGTDNTKTAIKSSLASAAWGQSVTFTATVSGLTAGAGGSVTFLDGNTPLATVPLGSVSQTTATAAYTTSSLSVASHSITAAYGGFNTLTPSAGTVTQTIAQAKTTATLQPVANLGFGQPVTFTAVVAVVSPGAGVPTGTVTFKDGTNTLGTGTLKVVNGTYQATFTPATPLAAGSHSITAIYNGDTNFSASPASAKLALSVERCPTTTVVTTSLSPAFAGQAVTFTATVSSAAGTPSGSVTFTSGSTTLQKGVPLVNGVAVLTTTKLTANAAPYTILATYSASGNFGPSSGTVAQTVNPDQVTTTTTSLLSSVGNALVLGQALTLTAQVAPTAGGGVPTGTVSFLDGSSTLGTGTLQVVNGVAQASFSPTTALAAGAHSITAVYKGDGNFKTSTSPAKPLTVSPAATTTVLSSLADPALAGQAVSYLVVVTPVAPGAGTPAGNVTVFDGSKSLGTVTLKLVGGLEEGTVTVPSVASGTHSLTATFSSASGQSFSASTSAVLTQVVVSSLTPASVNGGSGSSTSAPSRRGREGFFRGKPGRQQQCGGPVLGAVEPGNGVAAAGGLPPGAFLFLGHLGEPVDDRTVGPSCRRAEEESERRL